MTALVNVKSKDLKMRGFNALTQSIFDVKTAVFGKKMPEKVSKTEEPSNNIITFKVVNKSSARLRTTAILLHKQSLMEFKYEKNRFGKLKIGGGKPKASGVSPMLRKRQILKKTADMDIDFSGFRKMIDSLLRKIMAKVWLRIKRGIKRLIGKKGIKFIRNIKKAFRKIKLNLKLFRRFAFKPFRQARRFVQSLPKKAFNLSKSLVKKGISSVKTQLLKRGGVKGIKSSVGKVVKNTGKMLLKRFKLFYKAGPGRFIKKIPLVGSIIDFAINYFIFKEPLGKAVLKAAGAGIGAWAGGLAAAAAGSVIPFLGTAVGGTLGAIAGGMIGDALGGLLYDLIVGGSKGGSAPKASGSENKRGSGVKPDIKEGAKEGAKVKKPQFILVGEGGEDEWIVPKSRLGWWIAPLVGDIIEESVDEEQQENAKLKRETGKISEESVENVEQTPEQTPDQSKTWKPGKIFNPVIKLSKFFDSKSTDTKQMMSIIQSQERIIEELIPVDKPDSPINTPTQSPEPARTTLNNIDPDPEPDYAEVIPGLLESSSMVISQEPQMIPMPVPVGVDGGSSAAYAVWGRKVVGN
jgi:hypothetical protein